MGASPGQPPDWLKQTKIGLGDSITARGISTNLRKACIDNRKLAANTEKSCRQPSINSLKHNIRLYELAQKTLEDRIAEVKQMDAENSSIDHMQKSLANKAQPLQVAQQRLAIRQQRPSRELTADNPEGALTTEVMTIQAGIEALSSDLETDKVNLDSLANLKEQLKFDLQCKKDTIALDKQCHELQSSKTGVTQWYECMKPDALIA